MKITKVESQWLAENIGKIDFLSVLTSEQVTQLIEQATPRVIKGSQKIIQEGEQGKAFFIIFNGMVSVWVEREGQQAKLATLKNGETFGEISILSGKPTTADVVANVPTKVFFIDPDQFLSMVKSNEKLAQHVKGVMEKRLADREKEIAELLKCDYREVNEAMGKFLKN